MTSAVATDQPRTLAEIVAGTPEDGLLPLGETLAAIDREDSTFATVDIGTAADVVAECEQRIAERGTWLAPFNGQLLVEALAHILADPDHWDQANWRITDADRAEADGIPEAQQHVCGTSYCLGGWGIRLAQEPTVWAKGFSPEGCWADFLTAVPADLEQHVGYWTTVLRAADGSLHNGLAVAGITPFHRAQRLFGVNETQASQLFGAGNSLDVLQRMVGALIATDGQHPLDNIR